MDRKIRKVVCRQHKGGGDRAGGGSKRVMK